MRGGRVGWWRRSRVGFEDGEVLELAAEEQVHDRRVQLHAAPLLDDAEPEPGVVVVPALRGVVGVEARDAVRGVGGPVDQADALLGEGALPAAIRERT